MKIIIIILLFITLLILFIRNSNPYQLIMVFGKKGSGKSTFIAKYSQKYLKKGYSVFSNIKIPGTYLIEPKNLINYDFPPNSVIFIDEVALIWHNRDFKTFPKELIRFFKLQRHKKLRIYLFSQAFDDTDKVLRILTDKMYLIRRVGNLSIARPINKMLGISTDEDGNGRLVDTYKYGSYFDSMFTYLPRYYHLFDSFENDEIDELSKKNTYLIPYTDEQFKLSSFRGFILYKAENLYLEINEIINKFFDKKIYVFFDNIKKK